MHKRFWLFAGAVLAGLLLVAGASAMSMSPSVAKESVAQVKASHVLPAIAGVPDSPAARKAKLFLVPAFPLLFVALSAMSHESGRHMAAPDFLFVPSCAFRCARRSLAGLVS